MNYRSQAMRLLIVSWAMIMAGTAGTAFAAGTSCTLATRINADGVTYSGSISTSTFHYYRFYPTVGRSFVVMAHSTNPYDTTTDDVDLTVYSDATCTTTHAYRSLTSHMPLTIKSDTYQGEARGLIATSSTASIRLSSDFATTSTAYYLRVVETTMYAPWFYIGGDYNSFVILQNTTGGTLSYEVTVRNQAGAAATLVSTTLGSNATALVNLKDHAGSMPGGAIYGSVQVAHDGPIGAIRGHVANQSPTATVSVMTDLQTRPTP